MSTHAIAACVRAIAHARTQSRTRTSVFCLRCPPVCACMCVLLLLLAPAHTHTQQGDRRTDRPDTLPTAAAAAALSLHSLGSCCPHTHTHIHAASRCCRVCCVVLLLLLCVGSLSSRLQMPPAQKAGGRFNKEDGCWRELRASSARAASWPCRSCRQRWTVEIHPTTTNMMMIDDEAHLPILLLLCIRESGASCAERSLHDAHH